MFSRRTAMILGDCFQIYFKTRYRVDRGWSDKNDLDRLYDFLFSNEYSSWLCNKVRTIRIYSTPRGIKEFIMKLHTGETQYNATTSWSWEQRQVLGQTYLKNLAEDYLNLNINNDINRSKLINSLEIDGFLYKNNKLFVSEIEIVNTQEETGILENLYKQLNLNNTETALHHLELSTEHYTNGKWDDSISNSRKYLESVLREIAYSYQQSITGSILSNRIYESPKEVRSFLESVGILEHKEQKAIAAIYGLLSNTGSHPYIADNDQARLLRHLSLTITQFVMLRYRGSLEEKV